jgi:hypothetical protein
MNVQEARQKAYESRLMLGYAAEVYEYLNVPVPSRIYDMLSDLDIIEPHLYQSGTRNLGFPIVGVAWAGAALVAGISYISAIWQKSSAEKAKAECELKKMDLVQQGILQPEDLKCGTDTDGLTSILEKVRSIVIIAAGAAALVTVLGLFKK